MPPLLSVRRHGTLFSKCKDTAFSFIMLMRCKKNSFLFVFLVYFLYLYLTQIQAVFDAYTVCICRRYKLYLPQIQTLSVSDRHCDCFFSGITYIFEKIRVFVLVFEKNVIPLQRTSRRRRRILRRETRRLLLTGDAEYCDVRHVASY